MYQSIKNFFESHNLQESVNDIQNQVENKSDVHQHCVQNLLGPGVATI